MSGIEEFLEQIRRTLEDARSRAPGGPALLSLFERCDSSLDDLERTLRELQEYVVLRVDSGVDKRMDLARASWAAIPADRDYKNVDQLVRDSPTLSALYKASLDVRSVRRFGAESLEVADAIGRHSARWPHYARLLVDGHGRPTFGISGEAAKPMSDLIRILGTRCGGKDFRVEGRVKGKDGELYWRERAKIHTGREVTQWRVVQGEVGEEWRQLLRGHWLTAFAYGIAEDQFTRAAAPFELYSNVQYKIPTDLGGDVSDIDVLVRTADVLLCIECKAGKVLQEHRSGASAAAVKAARNAKGLDEVFKRMELGLQPVYQLTYLSDEAESDVQALTQREGVSIEVVRPADLRETIHAIASPVAS